MRHMLCPSVTLNFSISRPCYKAMFQVWYRCAYVLESHNSLIPLLLNKAKLSFSELGRSINRNGLGWWHAQYNHRSYSSGVLTVSHSVNRKKYENRNMEFCQERKPMKSIIFEWQAVRLVQW